MCLLTLVPCSAPSLLALKGTKLGTHYKLLANYNGQAELLLSLQIPPDYFPYQFKQRSLYDYLTNVNKYLVAGENASQKKKEMGQKLQNRLNELIGSVTTFGPSLWNEDLYSGGLVNRNVQFWNTKSADYLFLEQFIIDDSSDPLFLIQRLPKHSHLAITNFRAARDPYSIFGEDVYKHFKDPKTQNGNNEFAKKLHEYYKGYTKLSPNNLFRSGKYIEFWNEFCKNLTEKSKEQTDAKIEELFKLPNLKDRLFAPFSKNGEDGEIAKHFFDAIFTDEEKEWFKENKEGQEDYKFNYLKNLEAVQASSNNDSVCPSGLKSTVLQKAHHPALEHQTMKGSSPVSEGTQKELLVYLTQLAIALDKIAKTSSFESVFSSDKRKQHITDAWKNTTSIAKNYRERIKNIREYLKKIKVIDDQFDPEKGTYTRDSSKTVAIVSYPPSQLGAGDASIQTISKYSFLYSELGLKEVIPKNLKDAETREAILGVDDNGWWWRLGDLNFSHKGIDSFSKSADSIILLATEDDWNILNVWDSPKLSSLKTLLKDSNEKKLTISNYHLWNEGLRSPIALNLLLDVLVKTLTEQFGNGDISQHKTEYENALNWGDYWESTFVNGSEVVSK